MRTSFSWRLLDTRLVQTLSAEYSALPTAGKRGQKFCLKMKTPAGSVWVFIRTIRTFFLLHFGRLRGNPWFFSAAGPEEGSIDLEINAVTWKESQGNGRPQGIS